MLQKSNDNNNAIVARIKNLRKHPNADRLQIGTILGNSVVVDLSLKNEDLIIYFDSNLRLSPTYLHYNNLYSSKEMNANPEAKGYFGKNGRVRAQKFRGEMSNGYVAEINSLCGVIPEGLYDLDENDEFTHINGVEICSKYIAPIKGYQGQVGKSSKPISEMFRKHWDTKQLMRELDSIPEDSVLYIEEKIHGTSGRTGNVLCNTNRPWWKFWAPKWEWKIVSGTRRVDNINNHIPQVREEIERRVAAHLYKGETIYYEIDGYDIDGSPIQKGHNRVYSYGCRPGEFRAMLYRVTITTLDGFSYDLNRKQVYKRAEELGLEKSYLIYRIPMDWDGFWKFNFEKNKDEFDWEVLVLGLAKGKSHLDAGTLLEGIVVWFEDKNGNWTCLKHKSEEFLLDQDQCMEKEEGDVEDVL